MFYLQQVNFKVSENKPEIITYWSFTSKKDRDNAVLCKPTCYPQIKSTIPKGSKIKEFSHFEESLFVSNLIKLVEKA